MQQPSSIYYFDHEGSESNLASVLRILKRTFKKRGDLRSLKLVFFTAVGKGPALAYGMLEEYSPSIIAVTFPPSFYVMRNEQKYFPVIDEKTRRYFQAFDIRIVTGRLPFDFIDGCESHNQQMKLVTDVLSIFGGSFHQCIQAVLQACDAGAVRPGEDVIAVTGDCAAIITASFSKTFLSQEEGLVVREILCKPRTLNMARKRRPEPRTEQLEIGQIIEAKLAPVHELKKLEEKSGKKQDE